ncbi:barstar family protein [Rhodococcus sp. AG1013]|uniref:barstar family protein n=1 Tax=Rhodococcus sp. AG1013 TaxID=2183996 RepID=UPI000E0B1D45|nr:barstar family protein [Rhodococcus sp. AG1013]
MDRLDPATALTSNARPWVFAGGAEDLEVSVGDVSRSSDTLVFHFDATDMSTLDDLFEIYGKAFRFPAYFGKNWPAFDECLTDLRDMPSPKYLVVIEHAEVILVRDFDELVTFLKVCSEIGRYWSTRVGLGERWGGGEVAFNTLLSFSSLSGPVFDVASSGGNVLVF